MQFGHGRVMPAVWFRYDLSPITVKYTERRKPIYSFLTMVSYTGELGYDKPLYDGFLHMTDDMLGPSPMHIKYLSYVYDGLCI